MLTQYWGRSGGTIERNDSEAQEFSTLWGQSRTDSRQREQ